MATYKLNTPAFIGGHRLVEGTIFTIDNEWQPGPHCEPQDADAEKALKAYYDAHPDATLRPVEQLPNTFEVQVVAVEPKGVEVVNLGGDPNAAPQAGLANGGTAKATK
jgi:hypothetical protein